MGRQFFMEETKSTYDNYTRSIFAGMGTVEGAAKALSETDDGTPNFTLLFDDNKSPTGIENRSSVYDFGALRAAMFAYNGARSAGVKSEVNDMGEGDDTSHPRVNRTGHEDEGAIYIRGPFWWAYKKASYLKDLGFGEDTLLTLKYRDAASKDNLASYKRINLLEDVNEDITLTALIKMMTDNTVTFGDNGVALSEIFGEDGLEKYDNIYSKLTESFDLTEELKRDDLTPWEDDVPRVTEYTKLEPESVINDPDTITIEAIDAPTVTVPTMKTPSAAAPTSPVSGMAAPSLANVTGTGTVIPPTAFQVSDPVDIIAPDMTVSPMSVNDLDIIAGTITSSKIPITPESAGDVEEKISVEWTKQDDNEPFVETDPSKILTEEVDGIGPDLSTVKSKDLQLTDNLSNVEEGNIGIIQMSAPSGITASGTSSATSGTAITAWPDDGLDAISDYEIDLDSVGDLVSVSPTFTDTPEFDIVDVDEVEFNEITAIQLDAIMAMIEMVDDPAVVDITVHTPEKQTMDAEISAAVAAFTETANLRYAEERARIRTSLGATRMTMSTHADKALAILEANKERQIAEFTQQLVADQARNNLQAAVTYQEQMLRVSEQKARVEALILERYARLSETKTRYGQLLSSIHSDAFKFNADGLLRAAIASAENALRATIAQVSNQVQYAQSTHQIDAQMAIAQADNYTKLTLQSAQSALQAAMLQYESNIRVLLADAENATRIEVSNSELGTRASISNYENAVRMAVAHADHQLQTSLANFDTATKVGMTNVESQLRAQITNAEQILHALTANVDADTRIKIAVDECNTRLGITDMESSLRAMTATADAYMRVLTTNAELGTRVSVTKADNEMRAAIAKSESILRLLIAEAENVVRAGISKAELNARIGMSNAETATRTSIASSENVLRASMALAENVTRVSLSNADNATRVSLSNTENALRASLAHAENLLRYSTAMLDAESRHAIADAENALRGILAEGDMKLRAQLGEGDMNLRARLAENDMKLRAEMARSDNEIRIDSINFENNFKVEVANNEMAVRVAHMNFEAKFNVIQANNARILEELTSKTNIVRLVTDATFAWMTAMTSNAGALSSIITTGMQQYVHQIQTKREFELNAETQRWQIAAQRSMLVEGLSGLKWKSQLQNLSVMQQALASLGQANGVQTFPSTFSNIMQGISTGADVVSSVISTVVALA